MLSSKAKYAVRAMAYLAEHYVPDRWTQTADVAGQERIPRKFLEAIFVQLRGYGVIESRRGAHGGHRLRGDPTTVSVADIIRIIDGPLALTPCASRTRLGACPDCVDPAICRLQPLMSKARDAIAGVLESCSLAQLAQRRDGVAEASISMTPVTSTPVTSTPVTSTPVTSGKVTSAKVTSGLDRQKLAPQKASRRAAKAPAEV